MKQRKKNAKSVIPPFSLHRVGSKWRRRMECGIFIETRNIESKAEEIRLHNRQTFNVLPFRPNGGGIWAYWRCRLALMALPFGQNGSAIAAG